MLDLKLIAATDPEVAAAMELELSPPARPHRADRFAKTIVSPAVMAAMGQPLTNKYAEGYPGKRYYGGCQYVDVVENLARRPRQASCSARNMPTCSPTRGAQANMAVYFALLQAGRYRFWA